MDEDDVDVAQTARREAFEEVGLQASEIEIWGRLGVYPGKVCIECWNVSLLQFYLLFGLFKLSISLYFCDFVPILIFFLNVNLHSDD